MEEESTWEIIKEKVPNIKIYLVLAVLTLIAYANILPNGFVWDDKAQIVDNRFIQNLGYLPKIFLQHNTGVTRITTSFYRPLMNISYLVFYQIFGLKAWGFHLLHLILHIINVLLVFIVFNKILENARINNRQKIAFLAAAIFAVHAGISEAVQYIAAIGETFLVLFCLLFIYKLLTGINYESREIQTKNIVWLAVFGFLALASKESAAAIFFFGFLYIFFFLKPRMQVYLNYLAGASSAVLVYLGIRIFAGGLKYSADQPVPIAQASLTTRLMTMPKEMLTYLKIFFWPAKLQVYQDFLVRSANFQDFWLPLVVIIAVAIVFLLWTWRKPAKIRNLYWLLSIGYLIFLSPALNIIPLDMTVAERWLYFPSVFLIVILLLFLFSLFASQKKTNILATILLVVVIPTLTVRTIIRDGNWRSGLVLSGHDIQYANGDNASLENLYGYELYRAGNISEAKTHFEKSVAIYSDCSVSQNNLGAVFEKEGDFKKAMSYYQRAIEISDYNLPYENLANLLMKLRQYDEAYNFIQKAIQKLPNDPKLYFHLAVLEYRKGNVVDAEKYAETSLNLDPRNQTAQQFYTAIQRGQKIIFEQ